MRSFIMLLLVFLGVATGLAQATIPETARIPALQWEPRSDWMNVKTFGAKGDGVTDDTAAIQRAFNRVTDTTDWNYNLHNRVVYFPAGTYRITRTLTLVNETGGWIVGHGRDTVLRWDGAENGIMYLSNGATYTRYEGITWDGQGKAAVAVEHSSRTYYETSIRYEHCAFLNCKEHGVLIGRGSEKTATAEVWFLNCLFRKCAAGVSLLNFNDYDNTFDGCEFEDCGIGINSGNGNFYVRACHFERSQYVDVRQVAPAHASSLRLCTSQGSRRFFETPPWNHYSMKIQDCQVDGWTAPDGAISLGKRGPTTIFDCTFTNPPNNTPPIKLANPKTIQQLLIISNCSSPGTEKVGEKGENSRFTQVPPGKRTACLTSAGQRFLRETVAPTGKVLDVVKDFGAKANGTTDDTDALQAGIDAVRALGHHAVLYLPSGQYRFTRTLQIIGKEYAVSGAGFRTILNWGGAKDGEMVRVNNPQGVALEHFVLQGDNAATRIHHTADPGDSSIAYDEIYTNGCDEASTGTKGLWCDKLPKGAVVHIGHFIGNIRLTDCGAATVLGAIHFYSLLLEGATQPKTGIAGFMFHNDACHNYALEVLDDQDVIVADFYSESNKRYLLCTGSDGQKPGRVTIGGSKLSTTEDECITIRNYQGRIFLGGGEGFNQTKWGQPLSIVHEGTRPV
ncbi:MAG TPA: glycosyl hydrolase family 28-related protein, partial [Armatimonadota bacterium]